MSDELEVHNQVLNCMSPRPTNRSGCMEKIIQDGLSFIKSWSSAVQSQRTAPS